MRVNPAPAGLAEVNAARAAAEVEQSCRNSRRVFFAFISVAASACRIGLLNVGSGQSPTIAAIFDRMNSRHKRTGEVAPSGLDRVCNRTHARDYAAFLGLLFPEPS